MIDLNGLCYLSLANATQRQMNGGNISTETRRMLKHCATEVIEATEAWTEYADERAKLETEDYVSLDFQSEKVGRLRRKFESELADIICCCLIMAGKENIDIEQAINDCIEKNRKRAEGVGDKK